MTIDHPDYHALLAAVLADPADDVPRLVLADWLQDNAKEVDCARCKGSGSHLAPDASERHGTRFVRRAGILADCGPCSGSGRVPNGFAEYGEFIRVQCEIAQMQRDGEGDPKPGVYWDSERGGFNYRDTDGVKRYTALRKRERELWESQSGAEWLIHFPGLACLGPEIHLSLPTDTMARPGVISTLPITLVHRGFPDSVTLPLRLWVGEGGIGPELVRRCPLTRVTLTDREPEPMMNGGPPWGFFRERAGYQPESGRPKHYLPGCLYDLLDGCDVSNGPTRWKDYPTRQAALDALSAACLGWARTTPIPAR